ncbi:MAG: DUF6600 domain-containing protein [Candidatus Eisenbacteria bacterium]
MLRRPLVPALALILLALTLSCAVTGPYDSLGPSVYDTPGGSAAAPPENAMPAPRLGLRPEYRVFYDALVDEGDWTLIEPYGWCFRPAVNFVAWRPYQQGWWEPSDTYGWIWNSTERFGWITYHYGAWFYDRFQGWVWQPGPVWGPAWVAWAMVDDYVGWAPLAPYDMQDIPDAPDGTFQFVRAQMLASSSASSQASYVNRLTQTTGSLVGIENLDRVRGVAFNRGPDFQTLARLNVPMPQLVSADRFPRAPIADGLALPDEADLVVATRRMLDQAARELARARGIAPPPAPGGSGSGSGSGTPGGTVTPSSRPRIKPGTTPTPPDSTRAKKPPLPRGDRSGKPRPAAPDTTHR